MRFTTANPKQSAIMTKAFDEYCLARNVIDDNGKEDAASMIFLLFEGGARTAEEIRLRLQSLTTPNPARRRAAFAAFAPLSASQRVAGARLAP
jgi:hypothetical protein